MAYTHTTWGQLKTALAQRLSDLSFVYWTYTELGLYLAEALRTWSLLTGYWRDTGLLTTTNAVPFYDLTTLQNVGAENLLSYTVTDQDLVTLIQYHFLEPATGSSWTGSEQFTLADLTAALQRRRNQILVDTGCVITHTTGIATIPGDRFITVAESVFNIRRLAFLDASGVIHPLSPDDLMSQRNYSAQAYSTPGVPYSYTTGSGSPLEILINPPTNVPGTLDMISVSAGATLDPTVGVVLGLPDDYCMAVKWGAMADLLGKDGPARDTARAAFCERRYQLFVELIKMSGHIISLDLNGLPVNIDSISNFDYFDSTWQTTTGIPRDGAIMRDLLAVCPCPNGVYSLSIDVVRKAPIPILDGDFIQIGQEQLDAIIDYAENLAAFKMGGVEFKATYRGVENFFLAALAYNQRLTAQNPNVLNLINQTIRDTDDMPYRLPGTLGALRGMPNSPGASTMASGETNPNEGALN